MIARIGEPVRMSSETGHRYVASLKRVADGPPSQATRIAFEPQIDQVHDGIRVNVLSSQMKGKDLLAKIEVHDNRLLTFHQASYTETLKGKTVEKSPHDGLGLLQERLQRNLGIGWTGSRSVPRSRFPKWTAGGSTANGSSPAMALCWLAWVPSPRAAA